MKYTFTFVVGHCCPRQIEFMPQLEAPLELTFLKLHVGQSVIVPEQQGHPAHDALIAVTSFSETRRNHMWQNQASKEGG
jgi:hypothetical protein